MRASKFGLADLKRLKKEAAASSEPLPVSKPAPIGKRKAGKKAARLASEPQDIVASAPESTQTAGTLALNVDDQTLFRRAVKFVQPIKDTRRAILPAPPAAHESMLRQRRALAMGSETTPLPQVSDHFSPARQLHDESSFLQNGCGPDLIRGLKRGKWPIGASLDLHGATLDEARSRLDQFLQSCLTHQIKCVRIVHGKGYGSKDNEPVLKETVRRWLSQIASVIAYTECDEQNGGAGAVQVLLRVRES